MYSSVISSNLPSAVTMAVNQLPHPSKVGSGILHSILSLLSCLLDIHVCNMYRYCSRHPPLYQKQTKNLGDRRKVKCTEKKATNPRPERRVCHSSCPGTGSQAGLRAWGSVLTQNLPSLLELLWPGSQRGLVNVS